MSTNTNTWQSSNLRDIILSNSNTPISAELGKPIAIRAETQICLYFILQGSVNVTQTTGARTILINRLFEGEIFGEGGLIIDGEKYQHDYTPNNIDTIVARVPYACFEGMCTLHQPLIWNLLRQIHDDRRQATIRLTQAAESSAMMCVAHTLRCFAAYDDPLTSWEDGNATIVTSRKFIGMHAKYSKDKISDVLRKLSRDGLIKINGPQGTIKIVLTREFLTAD